MIKLFDSHCHLQDPRILHAAPKLIKEAVDSGVAHFAVNGVSKKDWHLVNELSAAHPSVIPNFGLHPWFVPDRTPNWLLTLKGFLASNPSAAVGEIGLDKGSVRKKIDFADQIEVFRQQLQLAKEIKRPASVHCVRAFGDLLEIMRSVGPFPCGVILHSYLGSAEMVPLFSEFGAYFSLSGFLMSVKESKARRMLKAVPVERILLETDAPDARPKIVDPDSLFLVEREGEGEGCSENEPGGSDNHPANIRHVLSYVARLLEMEERELAELSYENAIFFEFDPCSENYVDAYLNRADVQKALHTNVTNKISKKGKSCNTAHLHNWTDSVSVVLPSLKELLKNGIRLWILQRRCR